MWHGACVVITIAFLVCTLDSGVNAVSSETADTTSHTGLVERLSAESSGIVAIVCNASRLGANRTQNKTNGLDWTNALGDSIDRAMFCSMQWLTEQRVCERCTTSRCHHALCSPLVKILRGVFRGVFSRVLRPMSTANENAAAQCTGFRSLAKWVKHEALPLAEKVARVSTAPGHPPLPLNTLSSAVCHVSPGRNILTTCQHLPADT